MKVTMIKVLLKFVFAGGIILYLISQGQLDFTLITKMSQDHMPILIGTLALIATSTFLSVFRWKWLLELKTQDKLPFIKIMKLTWIGVFFSSVIPGAVSGDIIKLYYAKGLDKNLTGSYLLTSALMDRIIGLIGLLFLLGICSLINYNEIINLSPDMGKLLYLNFLFFVGVLFFFGVIFLPKKLQLVLLKYIYKIPKIGQKVGHLLEGLWLIGENKLTVIKCLILSVFMQANNVFALWFIASPFFSTPLPLMHAYSFVPLGMMAVAIPISPAGLGVGHAIFGNLFSHFGIEKGAGLFNLYFLAMITINLTGAIPYLLSKKHKPSEQELMNFEEALEQS